MQAWAARLASATGAATVHTFDYSYMAARKAPPKAETLAGEHAAQVRAAQAAASGGGAPVILVGKSMGSRVGLHVAAAHGAELNVAGAVCFGYSLIGMSGAVRDAVLREVPVPVLFVQGTKDAMCPIDRLGALIKDIPMPPGTRIVAVEGGDHSLTVGKKALAAAGKTQADVDDGIAAEVAAFTAQVLAAGKAAGKATSGGSSRAKGVAKAPAAAEGGAGAGAKAKAQGKATLKAAKAKATAKVKGKPTAAAARKAAAAAAAPVAQTGAATGRKRKRVELDAPSPAAAGARAATNKGRPAAAAAAGSRRASKADESSAGGASDDTAAAARPTKRARR
jgi:predicted alpha/beta-hydrolase family hydrolase